MTKRLLGIYALVAAISLSMVAGYFTASSQALGTFGEGFEAGGKSGYAAGNVSLGTGSWYLDDALTGNLANDHREGAFAVRIRNTGKVRMNFQVLGAGTVSIKHAVYGSDGESTWELWKYANKGSKWIQVGSSVTTNSPTLQNVTFNVNVAGYVKFEIRKVSGGTNRLNIDDISITNFGETPTPTVSPTTTPTFTPTPPASAGVHLTMGNPSNAVTDVNQPENYLMVKEQYTLSYHRDRGIPNWTSWHLDTSWIGSTPRQDDFRNDTTLPAGWYQVGSTAYSGSGYDRGHMCPSGDRTSSVPNNSATFLMTNMIPQAPTNNQQTWANLESYSRTVAGQGNELYIISGGSGSIGTINSGHVTIPEKTWKVIMVLPNGENDVSRVTASTRTIAVILPNTNNVVSDWRQYRVSVDAVEALTGFDFFSNVDPAIQAQIESVTDNQIIAEWELMPDYAALSERLFEQKSKK